MVLQSRDVRQLYFTIPKSQLVLRDYQKSSMSLDAHSETISAAQTTVQDTSTQLGPSTALFSMVTVEGTPCTTATNTVTSNATPTSPRV